MKAFPENTVTWLNNQISHSAVRKAENTKKLDEKKYEFSEGTIVRLQPHLDDTFRKQTSIFVLKPLTEGESDSLQTRNTVIVAGAMLNYDSRRTAIALTLSAHSAGIHVYQYDISGMTPPVRHFFDDIQKKVNSAYRFSQTFGCVRSFHDILEKISDTLENGYIMHSRSAHFASLFGSIPKSIPVLAVDPWAAHAAVAAGMERVINCIPDSVAHFSALCDGAINAVQTHKGWFQNATLNSLVKPKLQPNPLDKNSILHNSGHFVEIETVKSIERDCKKRISRAKRGEPLRVMISVSGESCNIEMYKQVLKILVPLVAPQKIALFINLGNNKNAWEVLKSSFANCQSLVTTYFNKSDSLSFANSAGSISVQGIHVFLNEDAFTGVYISDVLVRATDILVSEADSMSFYPVPKIFMKPCNYKIAANAVYSMNCGDGLLVHSFSALSNILKLLISDPQLVEYFCNAIVCNDKAGLYDGSYHVLESAMRKKIARVMYQE